MIDLSLPPYNVRGDWNRNDAAATDNTNAIKDAIAAAQASNTADYPDYGGTWGDTLILPKGSVMVSEPLVLGNGVTLQGSGDYSTCLVMKDGFPGDKHFVTLGSPDDALSSFGGKIRNMNLWGPPQLDSSAGVAMVYTNDAQDGTILDHVRIYGSKRQCFRGEIGYGGASIVSFKQVTGNTNKAGVPAFYFDYGGSTMVDIDGIEPAGGRKSLDQNSPDYEKPVDGTIGIYCRGGNFSIQRFHPEQCDWGILFNLKNADCFADVRHATGGPLTNHLFVIQGNPTQLGRIRLTNVIRNGVTGHIVLNGQSYASHMDAEIVDPIRL